MFKIQSEEELKACFRDQDQAEIFAGPETQTSQFPILVKDYFTWLEPSGNRAYLVFKDDQMKAPLGIVFRRDQTVGPGAPAMCDWCHSVRSGNEVGILTATSNAKKRVGISLCRDLSCSTKIKEQPGVHDFPSTASTHERIHTLIRKMGTFARRELI